MGPGSIVVIKPCRQYISLFYAHFIKNFPEDNEKTQYTIKHITVSEGDAFASFEEIIIGFGPSGEIAINTEFLIEILPPMDVQAIVEECMMQPV